MTGENISWSISTTECCRPGGSRTRNLLITSRKRIQLIYRGGPNVYDIIKSHFSVLHSKREMLFSMMMMLSSGLTKRRSMRFHLRQYRPRWLSWMRRPGDQEVAGSIPAEVGNILSWRLIMKYFLWSFSPFRWFKKGSCQFLAKECAQYWLTA